MDYFCKNKTIATVRLGSKYASVIINLILTLATHSYSKTAKINEIFIGTPHFFLKLVKKLKSNKFSSFGGPPWLHTKANSCQLSHLHRLTGLYLMSIIHRKKFLDIFSRVSLSPEQSLKIVLFSSSSFSEKMHWDSFAQSCSRDSEIISLYIL